MCELPFRYFTLKQAQSFNIEVGTE